MNQWVYDGFARFYKNLESILIVITMKSNTYLLGKDVVSK
jgi:arginyl-tRNA synthetase